MVYTSEYKVSTKTECNVFEGASTLGFLTAKALTKKYQVFTRYLPPPLQDIFIINKQIRGMKGIYREQKKERRKKER